MGDVIRKDFYSDPNAPKPTDKKVGYAANVVVPYGSYILMQQRSDSGRWALPGGMQDPGESITETAVREVLEETGVMTRVVRLLGVYSDPHHIVGYYQDEELLGATQEASMLFLAESTSIFLPELIVSDESKKVEWVHERVVLDLDMEISMRRRIQDYLFEEYQSKPVLWP